MTRTLASPTGLWEVAEALRVCVDDALEDTTQGKPDRSCVVWGAIAWDNCECGQLVVSIGDDFPSGQFPTQGPAPSRTGGTIRPSKCGLPLLVANFAVNLTRCAPQMADSGEPPPCSEMSAAAMWSAEDAWHIRNATLCCLRGLKTDGVVYDYQIGARNSLGPQGMCQGSQLNLMLGFENVCDCPES